jgi:glycosyltransferase involved in cell wall biosynthesis
LNVMILVTLKRLGILKNQIHFWSEANYLSLGALQDNSIKRVLRKYVFCSSNGALIVPGKMAKLTFEKWGIRNRKFIDLPNTIEENKFEINKKEMDLRSQNNPPIFLMPVRLVERVKGIINFFKAIGIENIRKGVFLIAGDGLDKAIIQEYIHDHALGENIKLLGYCETEKMVSLYNSANVFVLPSFSDPSPLSLVEALVMKLPLLVSDRCGNHFEAVKVGQNGFTFDPSDFGSIKIAFESLFDRKNDWKNMGGISGIFYDKTFNSSKVTDKFIRALNNLET